MHTGERPPPGYYPDPDNPRVQRWWDGGSWATSPTDEGVRTPPPSIVHDPTTTDNELANIALALSVGWIFFIGSVLGVIVGHVAMAQIRDSEGAQSGRGTAMIALIVGYTGIACGLLLALILAG